MRHLFPVILLVFVACHNTPKQQGDTPKTDTVAMPQQPMADMPAHTPTIAMTDTVPKNIQVDTVIHFGFEKDSSTLTARGSLNKKADPVICYLDVDRRATLNAWIIPEKKDLNIRFSQVIFPNGESDGPFDRHIKYELKQNGRYKFIIAPSNMASGKRSGDFLIRLQVKEK